MEIIDVTPSPAEFTEEAVVVPAGEGNQMLVKRIIKNGEGGIDATISLTASQAHFLLNFALTFLLAQGLALFDDTQVDEPAEQGDVVLEQAPTEGE